MTQEKDLKDLLVLFCDDIRDYERESGNKIAHDERDSIEFVELFLKDRCNR